jgi:hypothetical protein
MVCSRWSRNFVKNFMIFEVSGIEPGQALELASEVSLHGGSLLVGAAMHTMITRGDTACHRDTMAVAGGAKEAVTWRSANRSLGARFSG